MATSDAALPLPIRLKRRFQRHYLDDYDRISRMCLFHEIKAAYVVVPKSACSTIKYFFGRKFGKVPLNPRKVHTHEFEKVCIHEHRYPDYFYFSFVRNPWARLYSLYKSTLTYARRNWIYENRTPRIFIDYPRMFHYGMDFGQFVDSICQIPDSDSDMHFRSQYTFLFSPRVGMTVDFLGRVENFGEDIDHVQRLLKIPPEKLKHLNKSSSRSEFIDAYTPRLIRKVGERYEKDIRLFRYAFPNASH